MKKKFCNILLIIGLFSQFVSVGFASEIIKIKGKVVDKNTREPLSYVAIGVVGTTVGTTSNLDGNFELKFEQAENIDSVMVSTVGYLTIKLSIKDCKAKNEITIEMISKDYHLEEIEVTAKSMVLENIIRQAVANLSKNYIQKPFNYEVYYKNQERINDSVSRLREAAVKIYDSKGYSRGDLHDVFVERGYKFLQVRRSFKLNSLNDGATNLDDILEMDIVRVVGNILDANHLSNYDLKLDKITAYENDSVWVISYDNRKPSLPSTGDNYATKYTGKIYINKRNYAVVKNETQVEASNFSEQGRSFYVNENKIEWKRISVKYEFSCYYKQLNNQYFLSYVKYNRVHQLQNKTTNATIKQEIKSEMMINKVETQNPEAIAKRSYYENIKFDKNFWDKYNILLDEKK